MSSEPEQDQAATRAPSARGRGRRLARVLAFQTLYEMDLSHHRPGEVLQRRVEAERPDPEVAEFARDLVAGVLRHRTQLDELLEQSAPAFPLSQMSPVDRNILRIGIYESLYTSERVPVRVAVNEAVELAKRFGSESARRFVNGVLGDVVRRHQLAQDQTPPESQEP